MPIESSGENSLEPLKQLLLEEVRAVNAYKNAVEKRHMWIGERAVQRQFGIVVLLSLWLLCASTAFGDTTKWHQLMKAAVEASQRAKYQQSEKLLGDAVDEANKSKNKIWLAITLKQLGLVYQDQDEYEKAEGLFKRALAISEKALGPCHPQVADCLEHCAAVLRLQGKGEQASKLDKRAVVCLERCAAVRRMKGQNKDAEKLEARAGQIEQHHEKR